MKNIDWDFVAPFIAVAVLAGVIFSVALWVDIKATEAVSSCVASGRAPLECKAAFK